MVKYTDWILQVFYWAMIRKTKKVYLPNRRIKTEDIVKVIVEDVVRGRSVTTAVQNFQQYDLYLTES